MKLLITRVRSLHSKIGWVGLTRKVYTAIGQIVVGNKISYNLIDSRRESILIISHEASRTGVPVLSLNLAKAFSKKYNVVIILLGSGLLTPKFEKLDVISVQIFNKRILPVFLIIRKINHLCKQFNFKFAIVNSIESRIVLERLSKNDVPTVALIHEFASYTRPEDAFRRALFWSNEVVFSANVVRDNAISQYPELGLRHTHILPQGRCLLPADDMSPSNFELECERIRSLMRPKNLDPEAVLILGAGFVQIRKGIDLFIECATRVIQSPGGQKCRFIWIGKGYDPEGDIAYSVYIKDQIERAGLKNHIIFIDETPAIEVAYQEADLFLLSSRLDPLPNVAIEVMSHGVPVLCFNKTTGIADFLINNGLQDFCVAQYIDTAEMAQKILALVHSKSLYQFVASQCQQASIEYFDMQRYVDQLEQLGGDAAIQVEQEKLDIQTILDSGLFQADFAGFLYEAEESPEDRVRSYVRSWASGVGRRKPFPGFHPGIYLERNGVKLSGVDPLADYIRSDCPQGPWNYPVISDGALIDINNLPGNKRVALHIHAYYPDFLPAIVEALSFNQIKPDLFISVRDEAALEAAKEMLRNYQGQVIDIKMTPNRGRDIGPFLTQFGKTLLEQYEFIGHLHTKKSADVKDVQMGQQWYRFLLANLLGSKEVAMADAILCKLNTEPTIGIIFPDDPNVIGWEKNVDYANSLAQKMGIEKLPNEFLFPIGTMFWANADAIKGLIDLNLSWEDYPVEPLPYDGSLLHALERLVGFPKQNYQVATTYTAGMTR